MERYSEYKDSGVYYIPQIPSEWNVLKGKILFKQEKRPVNKEDEIVTCFRDGEVTLRKNRRLEGFTNSLKEIGYQGIRKGDLVIHNMDAFAGAIGVSDSDGKGTPVYAVCTPIREDANQFYYCYLLRFLAKTGFIQSLAKGIRERSTDFRYGDFKELLLPVPSRAEQDAIVRYLDSATSEIDKAIAMQQKMIDLLNERKQIIIQNAVTKGLDENVEMKESGVEWIGRIPKHWSKDKTMRMFGLYGSGTTPRENIEGGNVPWVNSGDLNNSSLKLAAKFVSEKMVKEISALKVYPKNSIIIAMYGASIGKISISKIECCTNQACFVLSYPYERIKLEYAFYSFMTCKKKWIEQSQGGTQPNINADIIKQTWLALPPLKEQEEIVHFIEEKCNNIEKTIETISRQITLLQERKQIIINEVVTGKVRVS